MRTILVTGGAGFIGTNFVYYWLAHHPNDRLTVLDALTYAGNRENLQMAEKNPHCEFIHGNILDQGLVDGLMASRSIDTIVHFAAESHVDRSIHDPEPFIHTNVVGTHTLLALAKKHWIDTPKKHRFHHISTDEVYGALKTGEPAFTETCAYCPNSPYAASKAASDHLVRAYHKTHGLDVTISNCSNNYGPFQFPEKFVPRMIVNILYNRPLPIYGDGLQIRDWLYVDDHNAAVELILERGTPGAAYNIGGNCQQTNMDMVHLICNGLYERWMQDKTLTGKFPEFPPSRGEHPQSLITHVPDRKGHDRRYAINAGKISSELGFVPRESLETGMEKTLDWFLAHLG